MKPLLIFVLLFMCLPPIAAIGGSYSVEFIVEQARQKKLPQVCAYMGVLHANRFPKGRQLRQKYGPDWNHMHHYCWALVDVQRGYNSQAIRNLDYVLRNSSSDFKLRPMVLRQKANILITQQQYPKAIAVYQEMVKINQRSEEGYVGLANTFILLGEKETARQIAHQGLKFLPESKKLQNLAQ